MIRRRIKQRLGHTGRLASAHSLDLLQLILGEMSDAASLDDLLERTVNSLHTALGNTATAALQLLPDDASLDCLFLRSAQAYHGSRELPIDSGLIGAATRAQQTVLAQDTLAELHAAAPMGWKVRSELAVPIITHHGLWGVLNLASERASAYPPRVVQTIEIVAQQLATAVEHTRLFTQAQETLAALHESHSRQVQLLEDIRRTQADLITASRLAAVGTLAAGVAHEFNNLLASMHGYAELGQSGTQVDKGEALEIIRRTCLRGVQITRNLLTFARQGDRQLALARVDTIVEGAIQLIGKDLHKAGISIERAYHTSAPAWVDSGQIMQVVLHLLTNARDAMPQGGKVTIATDELDSWVELSVADEGGGIPPQILEHIFEPFVTTKGALGGSTIAGTGLGLAVSYGIVQAHQGQLLVESSAQGSRFIARLPRSSAEAVPALALMAQLSSDQPKRILVVGVDAHMRAMLAALLNRAGHMVEQASDGQEVIERCTAERWDLIISDIATPRLDGLALIEQFQARGIATAVILLTESADSAGRTRARTSDASAVLAKPFDAATLFAAIEAALE
jgi:two-component system NtrC family sensor kinase